MIAYPDAPALAERRFATHDGFIWPVRRAEMRDPAQIVARMTGDIRALDMPLELLVEAHVVALGWTAAQVAEFGGRATALALFGAEAFA